MVTHGDLGDELLRTARMIIGELGDAAAIGLQPGTGPEELTRQLQTHLATVDNDVGVLCLTDIPGGTPARVAAALAVDAPIAVISGASLAMVLEVLMEAGHRSRAELVDVAMRAGTDGVIDLGARLRADLNE